MLQRFFGETEKREVRVRNDVFPVSAKIKRARVRRRLAAMQIYNKIIYKNLHNFTDFVVRTRKDRTGGEGRQGDCSVFGLGSREDPDRHLSSRGDSVGHRDGVPREGVHPSRTGPQVPPEGTRCRVVAHRTPTPCHSGHW